MKRQINNPYKVNLILYFLLISISFIIMSLGFYIQEYYKNLGILIEVIKNIGFGCFASSLVAFIIEIGNIKSKNVKLNELYENTYFQLKFDILKYLEIWSEFCVIVNHDDDYKNKKMIWTKWYELAKNTYNDANDAKKAELKHFLIDDLLKFAISNVNKSINSIIENKNLLEINDIYNNELSKIIKDFQFEFSCAGRELDNIKNMDDFWKSFDALNKDFFTYINTWEDIKYYNNLKIQPYSIFDKNEYIKAMINTYYKKNNDMKKK